jgi:hypothetical protein
MKVSLHNPIWLCLIVFFSCTAPEKTALQTVSSHSTLGNVEDLHFETLDKSVTGVDFNNFLDIDKLKSPMEYINVYNGGGVAIGDINNDGLPDLYFTGNLVDNQLYLNKGDFKFENITTKAGVGCTGSWSTGTTMYDVNGDGLLDIYVCRGYYDNPDQRTNLLFINNGDLTFTEQGKKYGIDDSGYSIVATFLDYDKDGHADLFVGNHPLKRSESFGYHLDKWNNPKLETSSKLYHNNGNGSFTDVTEKSGMLSYGWTLGVVAADLNQDNWTDLYVAVDHNEPDRYYLNNGNGTFTDVSHEKLGHMSQSSMGLDAADIDNNGLVDLAIVEMLGTDNFNEKTKMASMNPTLFWKFVESNYHYQYMRNMLQLNMGNGEFSEIGQMAGVHRTNWSWSSLLADFDNDGWKDLYVSNGYFREYQDKDYFKKTMHQLEDAETQLDKKAELLKDFGKKAPVSKVENNFFHNNGNLTFTESGKSVGLNFLGFSSGAAYADLDLDGDLDLVVNNINDVASLYRNQIDTKHSYLNLQLVYPASVCPIGTKVKIESPSGMQYLEYTNTRGYQSSTDGLIHFGLMNDTKVNEVVISWPDGKQQKLENVNANQLLKINYKDARNSTLPMHPVSNLLFEDVTSGSGIDFKHTEVPFDDYTRQVLLPHKLSQLGPFVCTADVNGDGLDDFYIGGGNGQPGAIYLQQAGGKFTKAELPTFTINQAVDDMGAAFVDVNGDHRPDLYVASGGNEFDEGDPAYQDRLYINTGNGQFQKALGAIPETRSSNSCVKPFDYDGDGDMDLFVGKRHIPGKYPSPAGCMLLENKKGRYEDATNALAPELQNIGMVTDAEWSDVDQDGKVDLVIVGEWMPITIMLQKDGKFSNATTSLALQETVGWWNRIKQADLNGDGMMDFVVGNLGLNYKYKASPERPFEVYAGDFDKTGTFDIALGYYIGNDVLYPVRGLQCSSQQMPELKDKFHTYQEYGSASIFEVYGDKLKTALHYKATVFASSILMNKGNGKFELIPLPSLAQIAPISAIAIEDLDGNGSPDLLVDGNLYVAEVETGRADGGKGCILLNDGHGNFKALYPYESGFLLSGDVKDIQPIKLGSGESKAWLVAANDSHLRLFKMDGGKVVF